MVELMDEKRRPQHGMASFFMGNNEEFYLRLTFQELMEVETALKQTGHKELCKKVKAVVDEAFPKHLESRPADRR